MMQATARAPWNKILAGAVVASLVALIVWWHHEPHEPVVAPPLALPHLKRPVKAVASDSPETDAPESEAPTQPVGTADLPEQLDRHQLEEGMERARPAVEKCRVTDPFGGGFVGTITVHLTIDKSGKVPSVVLVPPPERSPMTDCVLKAVHRNASFPKFRGTLLPTVELTYPFLFKEDGHLGP
jgi:hypothetical protein